MTKKLIAASMLLAFAGGLGYGFVNSEANTSELPKGLRKVSEKTEKVTHYIMSVTKDGMKAEFPIVKVGDTYYGLPMKLEKNGQFRKVEPKVSLVPVDGEFLSEADVEFAKAGIKNFVVWGEKNRGKALYVVFDALCPYCMKEIEKLPELKKQYSSITFLPLAVHGEKSVQGLSCIYTKAEKEGMEKALKEVFSWKEGASWEEYIKKLDSCKVDENIKKAVGEISKFLRLNKVYATPTFFLLTEKNGENVYYKRVGVPDFSLVEK